MGDPSCSTCAPFIGITRADTDPFWSDHIPPFHPNCKCTLGYESNPNKVTDDYKLVALPPVQAGWGVGRVPLSPNDENIAQQVEAHANRLGISADSIGFRPSWGGTGRGYNPNNNDAGNNYPGRSIEVGTGVTRKSATPWPEWDKATVGERIEAVLAHEHVEYAGGSHQDAIRDAPNLPGLSTAALAILRSQQPPRNAKFIP